MSSTFKLCPTYFSKGGEKFSRSPWYDLLFFEDLFAKTSAKLSVSCRLLNLTEHLAAGPNAQLHLVIAAT